MRTKSRVTGCRRGCLAGHTVLELLAVLGIPPERVAVEFNRESLRREQGARPRATTASSLKSLTLSA
ncbi:MAG: hypothetical protein RMK57_17370, partial [Bryobacterales bacterium]|nr:hypothetical protein [Bryobacterales bacterium]